MRSPLAEEYRRWQAEHFSGSAIYRPQAPASRASIYTQVQPKTLADYQQVKPSRFEQRPDEGDVSYVARVKGLIHHLAEELDPAEMERVATSWNSAVARIEGGVQTHAQLRERLDAKRDGTGRGLFGAASPTERATAFRAVSPGSSMSESSLQFLGHIQGQFGTPGQAAVRRLYASDIKQPNQQPQRPEIPSGSSGEGWMTSRG
jgi:hypothetical protein